MWEKLSTQQEGFFSAGIQELKLFQADGESAYNEMKSTLKAICKLFNFEGSLQSSFVHDYNLI